MKLLSKESSARNKTVAAIACGLWLVVGCDWGLDKSANRYDQLNDETKKLIKVLEQVTNEATATEHQAEIEQVAENIRAIQKRIDDAAQKQAGQGRAVIGRVTDVGQASLYRQAAYSAHQMVDHIRDTDAKAGAIVDKALEGVDFANSDAGPPMGLGT